MTWCGRLHPLWSPMFGLVVDDVVERVPAGELVRLDTGTKQGTVLTTPRDRGLWLEHSAEKPAPSQRQRSSTAGGIRHNPYAAEKLRGRLELPAQRVSTEEPAIVPVPRAERPTCKSCGQELMFIRPGRGLCAKDGCGGAKAYWSSDYPVPP
jgi:hypothetical protein